MTEKDITPNISFSVIYVIEIFGNSNLKNHFDNDFNESFNNKNQQ
ncbi:hypothetical protein [Methanobrevibacter sp.]